jgi:hypothetical protein
MHAQARGEDSRLTSGRLKLTRLAGADAFWGGAFADGSLNACFLRFRIGFVGRRVCLRTTLFLTAVLLAERCGTPPAAEPSESDPAPPRCCAGTGGGCMVGGRGRFSSTDC